MPLKHFYSANIQAAARNLRAKDRDFVMGIGAETYAELDDLVRKPPDVSVPASEQNGSTSKLCTGPSSKPDFMNERLDPQIAPSDNEEDDSGSEVVIISSSIIPKRRLSATSTPGPRSKRARVTRALSDEPELPDSESEEDSGEDESEYNDEEAVDPANQTKSDAAGKEFNSACRNCKSNANRALKAKYELQIFKLKSEHKQELRELKADKTKMLANKKKKASDERAKTKVKYEKHITELKSHRDEKIGDMVEKHKKATEEWQEKADKHKKKIKAVTAQRDEAEAKRKEIERSADEDIKAARDDLKAGERKLREEKKQMMREKQQEIDILKPHHSIIVKERDKAIRDLTQDAVQREKDVQSRDNALQRLQTAHETLQQQLKHLKTEHSDNQKHTKQVEKDLNDTKKYIAGVDGRADVRLVRAQEKIEVQETNVREHANRVITLQRENYNLKDTVNQLARLGREKRDEVERLKVELQSTKAELGVVKDMEGMSGGFD